MKIKSRSCKDSETQVLLYCGFFPTNFGTLNQLPETVELGESGSATNFFDYRYIFCAGYCLIFLPLPTFSSSHDTTSFFDHPLSIQITRPPKSNSNTAQTHDNEGADKGPDDEWSLCKCLNLVLQLTKCANRIMSLCSGGEGGDEGE